MHSFTHSGWAGSRARLPVTRMNGQMAGTKMVAFGLNQDVIFKVRPSSCSGQEEVCDDDDDDDSTFGTILFVYHGFCTGGTNFNKHRRKAIELPLQQHLGSSYLHG